MACTETASTDGRSAVARPAGPLALAALMVSAALAGCQTTAGGSAPHVAAAPAVNADPFAWAAVPGANTLNGTVAYHPQKKERWSCAEQSVALMPDAPASRARVTALYGSSSFAVRPVSEVREKSAGAGPVTFASYVKETSCDPDGKFTFTGLPDGGWYVIARAKREQPRPAKDDEGVAIVQRVVLKGGRAVDVKVPAF